MQRNVPYPVYEQTETEEVLQANKSIKQAVYHGDLAVTRFIMSVGDETFRLLASEAEKRNVNVQQLLRAVIVPEWVSSQLDPSIIQPARNEIDSRTKRPTAYDPRREPMLTPSVERSKRQLVSYLWPSTPKDD